MFNYFSAVKMSLKVYSVTRDLGFVRILLFLSSVSWMRVIWWILFHIKSDSRAPTLEPKTHLRLPVVVVKRELEREEDNLAV